MVRDKSPPHATHPDARVLSAGEDSDPVQIVGISVSPDPPKIGAELTVTIDAQVKETIEVRDVCPVADVGYSWF